LRTFNEKEITGTNCLVLSLRDRKNLKHLFLRNWSLNQT